MNVLMRACALWTRCAINLVKRLSACIGMNDGSKNVFTTIDHSISILSTPIA